MSIISVLEFSDVIDVLIVAVIAYYVIGYVRSTRAAQLVYGLAIVLGVYLLADVANLYTLNWLLKNLLSVGLIALVVVFQPELRRALEFLGRGRFTTRGFSLEKEKYNANIDILLRAIDYFAARKEGALIVVMARDLAHKRAALPLPQVAVEATVFVVHEPAVVPRRPFAFRKRDRAAPGAVVGHGGLVALQHH